MQYVRSVHTLHQSPGPQFVQIRSGQRERKKRGKGRKKKKGNPTVDAPRLWLVFLPNLSNLITNVTNHAPASFPLHPSYHHSAQSLLPRPCFGACIHSSGFPWIIHFITIIYAVGSLRPSGSILILPSTYPGNLPNANWTGFPFWFLCDGSVVHLCVCVSDLQQAAGNRPEKAASQY